jgi:hypothetical protein
MAGQITISTIRDDTGVFATQNGMTGIAKAWVNFNGTGTVAIRNSFNVSSITDNGTGDYTVNFTTATPNATYAVLATGNLTSSNGNVSLLDGGSGGANPTTTSARVRATANGGVVDLSYVFVAILSS